MGDDHAYLLTVSDWVNSLSLPLEATAAIVTCTRGAPARFSWASGVSRVFRFSVRRRIEPARACERPGQPSGTAGPGTY
jgi:hypothetical protein